MHPVTFGIHIDLTWQCLSSSSASTPTIDYVSMVVSPTENSTSYTNYRDTRCRSRECCPESASSCRFIVPSHFRSSSALCLVGSLSSPSSLFVYFPCLPLSLSLSLSLSAPSSFFISSSRHRLIIARGPEFHFALIECRATTLRVEPRVESTFPSLDTRRIHDSSGKISGYSNCLDGRQFRASGSAENARPLSDALSSTRVLSRRVTAAA